MDACLKTQFDIEINPELEKNLKSLKHLRELPRGLQVDSRIAAIQALLKDNEMFRTLHSLRWPEGVVCPRCGSTHVVKRERPNDAEDQRWHFECLSCKGKGDESAFDDLTGLPFEETIHAFRQWVLCWYLLGFCSISQISKILGISPELVMQLAQMSANITALPKKEDVLSHTFLQNSSKNRSQGFFKKQLEQTEKDELNTKSASLGRFKPGPKSKL
jgi:transposase-like protein